MEKLKLGCRGRDGVGRHYILRLNAMRDGSSAWYKTFESWENVVIGDYNIIEMSGHPGKVNILQNLNAANVGGVKQMRVVL